MGGMSSSARRIESSLTGLLFATLCCLATGASAQWREPVYPEPGDWIVPPDQPNEPNGSRIATGSCTFDVGRPGTFRAKLTVHAWTPEIYAIGPDHTWTSLGERELDWQRFRAEVGEGTYLEITVDYICAASSNTDLEFFYADWYAFSFGDGPQIKCPAHKPVIMAARCMTRTWTW